MRDVVIIGGGLSGLAAAYELEQHAIDYSLIEVKRHLGGSLRTIERDGFIMDNGTMAVQDNLDSRLLDALGLADALFPLVDSGTESSSGSVAFKGGTQQLGDALAQHITAPRLMRMAVSSIGELDETHKQRFAICLENGIMWDAGALIIAAPARYAERMFYGYLPAVSHALLDYRYDTIQRVSLGYPAGILRDDIHPPADMGYVFLHRTQHPARVPGTGDDSENGGDLLQFGMRIAPERCANPADLVRLITHQLDLPQPAVSHIGYWSEADPISCYNDDHTEWVTQLRAQLPAGIALIGSDYSLTPPQQRGIVDLAGRIEQGRAAACQVIATL